MRFESIYKNITGLSCPWFGIQWNPPVIEIDEAKKVVVYLENKRVLFNPSQIEDAQHCLSSAIEIRNFISDVLPHLSPNSPINKSLRRMRKSSLHFCDVVGHPKFQLFDHPVKSSLLERELYKLRKDFGMSLAELAVAYGLDVEDGLASIIPFNNANNI
jgi:hypothetical protein